MTQKVATYLFEGWFSIDIPDSWEYYEEDQIINIYSSVNPKGAIQISVYRLTAEETKISRDKIAEHHLITFIEGPDKTIAIADGTLDGDFIKIWALVNQTCTSLLIITYISEKKSRELSKVGDIVYSIFFDYDH